MENPVLSAKSFRSPTVTLEPSGFAKLPLPDRQIQTLAEHVELWSDKKEDAARGKRLYLIGVIKYDDGVSMRRRYFCYRFSPKRNRFVGLQHPNYSYED
jgi:hypothetical protein